MSVGRNELCPCGSGKKYKKCCGIVTPITQLQGSREQKMRQEYMQWIERFNRFISAQLTKKEIDQARIQFASATGLTVEECENQLWDVHFLNWFVFDVNRGKTTLIQDFIRQYGKRMDRSMQQAFLEFSVGVYEIAEIDEEVLLAYDIVTGKEHKIVGGNMLEPQKGQLVFGRLLPMGTRDLLFSGSLILQAVVKDALVEWMKQAGTDGKEQLRAQTLELYRLILQSGPKTQPSKSIPQERLVRRVYNDQNVEQLRKILDKQSSFELKKRSHDEEIWVYSARKEEYLFRSLNNALLELHEVLGEVLFIKGQLWVEGFGDKIGEIEQLLQLDKYVSEEEVTKITSTNTKLSRGTIFITSQPTLPKKVLHWAVQTYFAEKWLVTPQPEVDNLPPVLAAASNQTELRVNVERLVEKMEDEAQMGIGAARFMRVDLLRPSLALGNDTVHIQNLLQRPLVHGLPDSSYTVTEKRLEDIAQFVSEVTNGKSDATVKKYDEAMNLFRSFIRSAFGPEFTWEQLRKEEVAYFLVQDVTVRSDALTKTLATNLLSVLSAFFKWVDKQYKTQVSGTIQPLLSDMKEDLPETYKLVTTLQRGVSLLLADHSLSPQKVEETHLLLLEQQEQGWLVKTPQGQTIQLEMSEECKSALAPDWMLAGLIGQTEDGTWQMYGAPKLYPPAISTLLGVAMSVLV